MCYNVEPIQYRHDQSKEQGVKIQGETVWFSTEDACAHIF